MSGSATLRPPGRRIVRAYAWAGLAWIIVTGAPALWLIQNPVIRDPYLTGFTVFLIAQSIAWALLILRITR